MVSRTSAKRPFRVFPQTCVKPRKLKVSGLPRPFRLRSSAALITYASARLRAHHGAAFTCALLNNQPMGFHRPFTLVKDAQRHGVRFRPVDVAVSEWD
jgi:hypothetical protein